MKATTTSPRVDAYRQLVRGYRRLIRYLDRVIANPAAIKTLPVDQLRQGSAERRLLDGLRRMVERLESGGEELRRAQERLELAMRGANDGLWDWDLITNEVYYSPRWKEMLGYADHEIANEYEEWESRVHPDDLDRARATIDAFHTGASPTYHLEHRLRHRDGSYRWIVARGAAVHDPSGRMVRMAGSHADYSARRRAEESLREREAQYRMIFEETSDGLAINDLETGVLIEANPAFLAMHGYARAELIGREPTIFIHPSSHHLFQAFTEACRRGEDYHCQAVDVRKDCSQLHVEVHGSPITYQGRPATLAVVRDVTERIEAYQLLERRVAERTREIGALLEVSNTVASTLELKPLLGLILDQLKSIAEYTGASILTIDQDELEIVDARGASAGEGTVGLRFPLVRGTPIAELFDRRETVIIDDVLGDSRLARAYRGATAGYEDMSSFSYARAWMGVPMVLNDRVTGILSLSYDRPDFYTPEHARLAGAIANQAAVAIENAKLYGQAQALAVMEERARLARELHDSVTQSLFSMTMISGAVPRLLDRDQERARERVDRLHELSQGALAEMRALIFELHPESLEREGLLAALEKLAAAVRARHGLAVDLRLPLAFEASLTAQETLFRIAQEAINNSVKHARAATITVGLSIEGDEAQLAVRDDGIGFDPTGPFPGHLGHRSMRERAERLGGNLTIESRPGDGTRVRARIPLDEGTGNREQGTVGR